MNSTLIAIKRISTIRSETPGYASIEQPDSPIPFQPIFPLSSADEQHVSALAEERPAYRHLDRATLLAIIAARQAIAAADWRDSSTNSRYIVNIGSSRGATHQWEACYDSWRTTGNLPPYASPVTTLGNLSSYVLQDLEKQGLAFDHSITCSTSGMAVINAIAWLRAGMADRALVGGSEAPLTPFTLAQMSALGIYSPLADDQFPCRPFGSPVQNTLTLGEGAAVLALELVRQNELAHPGFMISGFGTGTESIPSPTGMSASGIALQQAMRQALQQMQQYTNAPIDVIIAHAPGTIRGDQAEYAAIQQLWPSNGAQPQPHIISNKWQHGHTLGASAALSIATACAILQTQQVPVPPYPVAFEQPQAPAVINHVMVNSVGFGGVAVSVVVSRV
jgi:3-oxoacyl-[acyl-carrier-protein] synthase II